MAYAPAESLITNRSIFGGVVIAPPIVLFRVLLVALFILEAMYEYDDC